MEIADVHDREPVAEFPAKRSFEINLAYNARSGSPPRSTIGRSSYSTFPFVGVSVVVLGEALAILINQIISIVKKLNLSDKTSDIIVRECTYRLQQDTLNIELFCLEQEVLSATHKSSRRTRICQRLVLYFVEQLECQLKRGAKPYSDGVAVTILPFRSDMRDYLPNMSFLVYQVTYPVDLTEKKLVMLLLTSQVLCSSCESVLKEHCCEDQAIVVQENASYLVTENHVVEGLVQLSPLQNTLIIIVGYNSEKCSVEMVESLQADIETNFEKNFPSEDFTIQLSESTKKESKAPRPFKNGIEESKNNGQNNAPVFDTAITCTCSRYIIL